MDEPVLVEPLVASIFVSSAAYVVILALRSRCPEPVLQIANRSIPVSNAEHATGSRPSESSAAEHFKQAVTYSDVNHCTPLPVAGGTMALPIQIPATDAHFIADA